MPEPPTVLFAQGNLDLLRRNLVAIVGSRDHTAYGASVCRDIADGAARAGLVVVSGMARGLDAVAHCAALDAGGGTVGILGNGLGVVYPAANRSLYGRVVEAGLLLTEFPPGERPGIGAFPRRNRLISALARVTVVVEAAQGSGALITVEAALTQGRDVMAVPGNITSPTSVGTNRLIRDGAEPLLGLDDLLAHYPEVAAVAGQTREPVPSDQKPASPTPPENLSEAERRLFDTLCSGPAAMDDLIQRAGLRAPEALAALSGLELRGAVAQVRGVIGLV
jgi:DNA processing protein